MTENNKDEAPKPTPRPPVTKAVPKKRTSVPPVEKAKQVTETAVDALAEKTQPIVTPTVNNPKETPMNKVKALVINNQDTIKRKLVVVVGTGIGMLIASTVIDNLGVRKPDVVYLELNADTLEPVITDPPVES
jgi:hypothetical protein